MLLLLLLLYYLQQPFMLLSCVQAVVSTAVLQAVVSTAVLQAIVYTAVLQTVVSAAAATLLRWYSCVLHTAVSSKFAQQRNIADLAGGKLMPRYVLSPRRF